MTFYNVRGIAMPESRPESGRLSGTAAGNETITAGTGDISLSGESGGDLLIGSTGDNRFFITSLLDRVQETAGGGVDTVIAYQSWALGPNVENLIVHQDFNYAVGNSLDNLIIVDGSQWVNGLGGDDVLVGSTTQRTSFQVQAGNGSDVIYNWNGNSQIQLLGYGLDTPAAVRSHMTQSGGDVVIQLSSSETLTIRGATTAAITDRQLLLQLDRSKLGVLTFGDEFNSLSLYNPSTGAGTWNTNFGGNLKDHYTYALVNNGERQAYVAPGFQGRGEQDIGVNPFSVAGGVVTITAKPTAAAANYSAFGAEYTSGMLNTFGSFSQKYGYFEMRAELPTAVGTWPAFWLLPSPYLPNAEADIMEALGLTPNVDYRRAYGGEGGSQTVYDNAYVPDAGGFHTYGMLWTAQTVTFYRDGVTVLAGATPSTWTSPMSMIVNLAVGGFGGVPNAAQFPAQLKIDYIHAYALADGSSQVVRGTPDIPVATLRDQGSATGQVHAPVAFEAGGGAVSNAHIQVSASHPTALPPGKTFMIWEDAGAVFGAVSDGTALAASTPLLAGTASQFTGAGTWLSDGKVVFSYDMPNAAGGHDLWDMVFDTVKKSFVRQNLGPAAAIADAHFVATAFGGFAVSWHAPDGGVVARGYDEYAYGGDVPGWYGPTRPVTGDLTGVNGQGQLIFANGPGQELYTLVGASQQPAAPGGTPTQGDDQLQASAANPEIHALGGNDTINGALVGDYLRGDEGDDLINGGRAFDDINGNMGNDTAHGGLGDDWVVGGKDNDSLTGDEGADIVYGNLGDDTLEGGPGNDLIRGGQGNDVLRGGDANDWLSGDRGSDTVSGGAGADIFHTFAGAGLDRVLDFNLGEGDRVAVDAGGSYTLSQVGADTVIDFGAGDQMVLVGVTLSTLPPGWIFTV